MRSGKAREISTSLLLLLPLCYTLLLYETSTCKDIANQYGGTRKLDIRRVTPCVWQKIVEMDR